MKTSFQSLREAFLDEPKRLIYLVLFGLLLFWLLRGCFSGRSLPDEVMREIERAHIVCISSDDTPIWPGEPRQPECGRVNIEMVAEGQPLLEEGVEAVLCYRITVEYPRWQTIGQTRHEVLWSERSYSKVTVYQGGDWQLFPDQDQTDEQRWLDYGCPGAYGAGGD